MEVNKKSSESINRLKSTNSQKIIIETKQVKKVRAILDRENIEYKFRNLETSHKSKTKNLSQDRDIKKIMKDFEKAMVKTK